MGLLSTALRKNYDPQVPSECGSCVTLKFTRVYEIDELAPAKLTVYPTMEASSRTNRAYQQFFYINGTLLQDMSTTNGTFISNTNCYALWIIY